MNLSSNLSSLINELYFTQVTNASHVEIFSRKIINYAFYPVRMLSITYYIACVFWLFYIIPDIYFQLKHKRSLLKRASSTDSELIQNNLFQCRERLVRNSIFLVFLIFEISFNLFAVFSIIPSNSYPQYPLEYNCTKIVHIYTEHHSGLSSTLLTILSPLEHFSFSMIIWLLGASLIHLSFAARNELRIIALILFIFGGIMLNLSILTAMFYIYPRIYAKIVHSFVDQFSLIVVLYISRKKFFPAMNSRVIDAFHLNSLAVYNTQKRLLRRYKILVRFLLITLELYVFKDLFFYNTFLILHSLGIKSCLNHSSYLLFPIPSYSTTEFLYRISYVFLFLVSFVDTIVYFNICLVNFAFICCLAVRFVRRKLFLCQSHRFHVLTAPLNPHAITVMAYK